MKLAIMQPYFFPYIGYFQLIKATNHFVFFDISQYERKSWMNRNRIINLKESFTYITVPIVKAEQKTALNQIKIDNSQDWRKFIMRQLDVYRKRAPYFNVVTELIKSILDESNDFLYELNINSVVKCCEYLGLLLECDICSKLSFDIPNDCEPDEWALYYTKRMNYNTYVNAPGGASFFDVSKYKNEGIDIKFIKPTLTPYIQKIGRFEAGLSIIDVMMFNDVKTIHKMLGEYSLE